jgi:hypothetical protein
MKLIHAGRLAAIEEVLARLESGGSPAPTPSGPRGPAGPTPFERDQSRRRAEPSRPVPPAPSAATDEGFASQLIARVEAQNKNMLGIHLERAVSWDLRAESVIAGYPAGTTAVNMPSGDDLRLLSGLASEVLGRAVTFRATLLQNDAAVAAAPQQAHAKPPATSRRSSPPDSPAQAAGAQPGTMINIGTLADNPEIADFVRFFPGAKIEEQKRKS